MLRKVCSDSELPKELDRFVSFPAARASWASLASEQSYFTRTFLKNNYRRARYASLKLGQGGCHIYFFSRGDFPAALSGDWSKSRWDLRASDSYLRFLCSPVSVNWYSYIEIFNPECSQGFRRACGKLLFFCYIGLWIVQIAWELSVKCFWMGKLLLSAQLNWGDFFFSSR